MFSVGRHVRLPRNTDPSKTYAYRSINKFIEQVREWKINDLITYELIREIVRYGDRNNLLNKGTALLNMGSILKICYSYLNIQITKTESLINDIVRSNDFINKKVGNCVAVDVLIWSNKNGFANMVKWFRSGEIGLSFISISVNCRKAMNLLHQVDRYEFPSDELLLNNRIKILGDVNLFNKIKPVMGEDLLTIGLSMEHIR
jgi:hypothetical protein